MKKKLFSIVRKLKEVILGITCKKCGYKILSTEIYSTFYYCDNCNWTYELDE